MLIARHYLMLSHISDPSLSCQLRSTMLDILRQLYVPVLRNNDRDNSFVIFSCDVWWTSALTLTPSNGQTSPTSTRSPRGCIPKVHKVPYLLNSCLVMSVTLVVK